MASLENSATVQSKSTATTNDRVSFSGSDEREMIYTPPQLARSTTSTKEHIEPVSANPVLLTATLGPSIAPTHTAANISVREYIYFLPYPLPPGTPIPYSTSLPHNNPLNLPSHQFEPTSTLVLTSPRCTFVDIRLFKPFQEGNETALPNKGERDRLEWAFAGSSESRPVEITQPIDTDENESEGREIAGITHSTWTHWLDTRHPVASPNIPIDEGDMYPITPDLTLEHGHAFQPSMQTTKTHEEMWRDVSIVSTTPSRTKICIVLRLQDDPAGVRGVIIRLGQYCQGLVMQGTYSTVERWEFVGKEWKRIARVGDQFLPCAVTWRPEMVVVGGRVRYHDYEWVVEECWEWE